MAAKKLPSRRRRVGRVQAARPKTEKSESSAVDEVEAAMVEKMIEEDERRARESETAVGPGFAVLALQEQLQLLKAEVEAMQKLAASQPAPPPPRDDEEEIVMSPASGPAPELPKRGQDSPASFCPVAPPPPTPFKTPLFRRATIAVVVADSTEEVSAPAAPTASLSELIREQNRNALKETGIPRSPGGTPARRKSESFMASSSPRGLLSSALNRKFKSVRMPVSPVVRKLDSDVNSEDEWDVENAVENK